MVDEEDMKDDIGKDIEENEVEEEAICGDTICEREKGESYENCPKDCVPEKSSEDTSEISNTSEIPKRQGNLWIMLVPIIAIILIVVTIIIILKHKRGR